MELVVIVPTYRPVDVFVLSNIVIYQKREGFLV